MYYREGFFIHGESHVGCGDGMIDRICNLKDIEQGDKDFIPLYVAESRALLEVLKGTAEHLEDQLLNIIEYYETQYGRKSL